MGPENITTDEINAQIRVLQNMKAIPPRRFSGVPCLCVKCDLLVLSHFTSVVCTCVGGPEIESPERAIQRRARWVLSCEFAPKVR